MTKKILTLITILFLPYLTQAQEIELGKPWASVEFKKGETMATTRFKAWLPHPPEKVWHVLIDTNSWKTSHSEYKDSRTLSENQFNMVEERKPDNIRGFYELIGDQIFPSELNRKPKEQWTSFVFQRFNLPWPLSDRWNVMKVKNDENNAKNGQYRYEYKTIAGNFKELRGYWELKPVEGHEGWTEFSGEYKADPGIDVPQFLAKSIFKASIKRSVKENIEILNKQK